MFLFHLISNKSFLLAVIICNLLGTAYGYYWYSSQLTITKPMFYPFVPDSPTATLFLTIALIAIYFGKNIGLVEALAFVTLIKYGIWAVLMNLFTFIVLGEVTSIGLMLCISHGIMAIQAFLFLPLFKIKPWHLLVTIIWVFHNDVIDYVYMQYPIYSMLSDYIKHIGYLSFWLSVVSIAILWFKVIRRNNLT